MQVIPDGLPPDGEALLRNVEGFFDEDKLVKSGGYMPPASDPRQCEPAKPALPGHKGGFQYRIEHKQLVPFNRCDRIACQVRDRCTTLVKEELEK